jgi:hypothetical protein
MLTHNEPVLSFGLPHIDNVFLGFKSGDSAVLYGHNYVKTLSFLLSVRCQLSKEDGGLASSAIYVDGGNVFNPYAVSAIAREYGLDPKSTLERIFVSRAFTAYQLSALVFEKLEDALKQYRSKLVLISDITSLFLDKDVPTKEAVEVFNKAVIYLSDLATKRNIIVVTTSFSHQGSRRGVFLESLLFGRAGVVVRIGESKGKLQLALESHPFLKPFSVDMSQNAATLEGCVEA